MNRENIIEMLEKYEAAIERLKSFIKSGDADALYREFDKAKEVREKL